MLLYLDLAYDEWKQSGRLRGLADLRDAIYHGAVKRVRPKAMTVAVVLSGLIPIMVVHGAGSEVMQRIAAPMVGGMITAPLLSMFVIPAAWLLLQRRRLAHSRAVPNAFAVPTGTPVPSSWRRPPQR